MLTTIAVVVLAGLLVVVAVAKILERRRRRKRFGKNRDTELLGKHVVITGGSSGIGLNVGTVI